MAPRVLLAGALVVTPACAAPNPAYNLQRGSTSTGGAASTDGTTKSGGGTGSDGSADAGKTSGGTDSQGDVAETTVGVSGMTGDETSGGSTGGTPYDEPSPCCTTSAVPGCVDDGVEACVCAIDPYCCDTGWDDACVKNGVAACGLFCYGEQPCCVVGDKPGCQDLSVATCVCDKDPSCCNDAWTVDCAGLADGCTGVYCPLGTTSCCASQATAQGCKDFGIQACVCGIDPLCCGGVWDSVCVVEAIACGSDCETAGPTDCCDNSGATGGCTDNAGGPGVQNCVCDMMPTCCTDGWITGCLQLAIDQCGLTCA